jgi:putative membrane protein
MQRVSPVAVGYFALQHLQKFAQFLPIAAGALLVPETRQWLLDWGLFLAAALVLGSALLSYWCFWFEYDDEKIHIHQGVLFKKSLVVPFDRIQDTQLKQPVYFRPFDIWSLVLESAGSTAEEIVLPGVPVALAEAIGQRVLAAKHAPAAAPVLPQHYSLRLGTSELARYGIMHNHFVYYLAIASTFISQSDALLKRLGTLVQTSPVWHWLYGYWSSHAWWASLVLALLAGLAALVMVYGASILFALIKYWDYHLQIQQDRYFYQAGLFTKLAGGFREHKWQTLIIRQSLLARLLRRYSLEVRQTNEARTQRDQSHQSFVVPVLTQAQLEDLLRRLKVPTPHWQKSHPAKILADTLSSALPILGLFSLLLLWLEQPFWPLAGIALALVLLQWLRWQTSDYALSEQGFAHRRGLLGREIRHLGTVKIQKIDITASPLQRLCKTGSLSLWSGATVEYQGYIPLAQLRTARAHWLQRIATFTGRWI